MTKILTNKENGTDVKYVIPDDAPRISVDGFGPSLFGFPLTTLTLCQAQISEDPNNVAERKVVATLHVPTITLLELAENIRKTLAENKNLVDAAIQQVHSSLDK